MNKVKEHHEVLWRTSNGPFCSRGLEKTQRLCSTNCRILIRTTTRTSDCVANHTCCLNTSSVVMKRSPTPSTISLCRKHTNILAATTTCCHAVAYSFVLINLTTEIWKLYSLTLFLTTLTTSRIIGVYHTWTAEVFQTTNTSVLTLIGATRTPTRIAIYHNISNG